MRICVSSTGPGLDSQVDPRFGRCAVFVLVDTETLECDSVENEAAGAIGGAGISSAQMIASKGVEAVVTGNVGPNAFSTLSAAGIRIYVGASGTVRQAVEMLKAGRLMSADQATSAAHSGMGAAYSGMGRGGGMGAPFQGFQPGQPLSKEQELQQLQNCMNMLKYQIEQIQRRIEQLKEE